MRFIVNIVVGNSSKTGREYVGTYTADSEEHAVQLGMNDPYFLTLPERQRKGIVTATPA